MKRALGLIFIIIAFVMGFLSIRGVLPFMPITGSSMEPALQSGSMLMIEPIHASEVEVGDIIVFNVPRMVQEYYSYPPVVAHRVIKVTDDHRGITIRTKGDNTGEDPFTVRPQDLRGTVGDQIPYLGLPFLFFQSQQGLIFVITALALLAFFLYSGELDAGRRKVQKGVFAPVIQESHRTNRILSQKIEASDQRIDATQQALVKFSAAIELYAEHLSSHTSAIQGLSEASHELKRSAAEQNRVLIHFMETTGMETTGKPELQKEAMLSRVEKAMQDLGETAPEAGKGQFPPGCARSQQEPPEENTFRRLHPPN